MVLQTNLDIAVGFNLVNPERVLVKVSGNSEEIFELVEREGPHEVGDVHEGRRVTTVRRGRPHFLSHAHAFTLRGRASL